MSTVVINGKEYSGEQGERLIDVARRNGAHVGFVCNGAGFCQTCACRVTQGNDQLTPHSDAEKNWFQQSWLDEGHRLACQSYIEGSGRIELMSRVEELRRLTVSVFSPSETVSTKESVSHLGRVVGRIVLNQVSKFPLNAVGAFPFFLKVNLAPQSVSKWAGDVVRVVQTMQGTPQNGSGRQTPQKILVQEEDALPQAQPIREDALPQAQPIRQAQPPRRR